MKSKFNSKDFSQISHQGGQQKKYTLLLYSQQQNKDVIQLNQTNHHSSQSQISNQIQSFKI